jgi:hypothetical protein
MGRALVYASLLGDIPKLKAAGSAVKELKDGKYLGENSYRRGTRLTGCSHRTDPWSPEDGSY